MGAKHQLADRLQDVLHYAGTILQSLGAKTPHAEYTFVGQAATIRERVDMYDRMVERFSKAWDFAHENGLVEESLNYDSRRESLVTDPPDTELRLMQFTQLVFEWTELLAKHAGVDAFHGRPALRFEDMSLPGEREEGFRVLLANECVGYLEWSTGAEAGWYFRSLADSKSHFVCALENSVTGKVRPVDQVQQLAGDCLHIMGVWK